MLSFLIFSNRVNVFVDLKLSLRQMCLTSVVNRVRLRVQS
jgi:hypothetical protein